MPPDPRVAPLDTPTDTMIRPATQADLPAVGRLGALLVGTHHEFDPQRFLPATSRTAEGYASYLATQLEQPAVAVLVAEEQGQVVGYTYAAMEGTDYMGKCGGTAAVRECGLPADDD
jgi:hypothetical protein